MAISATDAARGASSAYGSATSSMTQDTEDRFLTLLVTQLQNQDPLNPMDNAQVTSQMAQLSTVTGINQLNETLSSISGQVDLSQALQASQFVGKDVLVPGAKISMGDDAANPGQKAVTPFGIDLVSAAATVTVNIKDSSGAVVKTMTMENQDAGVFSLEWDGVSDSGVALANGAYSLEVTAVDATGQSVVSEALTYGHVNSVAYTSEGLKMDLGLAGTVLLSDLRKVLS